MDGWDTCDLAVPTSHITKAAIAKSACRTRLRFKRDITFPLLDWWFHKQTARSHAGPKFRSGSAVSRLSTEAVVHADAEGVEIVVKVVRGARQERDRIEPC